MGKSFQCNFAPLSQPLVSCKFWWLLFLSLPDSSCMRGGKEVRSQPPRKDTLSPSHQDISWERLQRSDSLWAACSPGLEYAEISCDKRWKLKLETCALIAERTWPSPWPAIPDVRLGVCDLCKDQTVLENGLEAANPYRFPLLFFYLDPALQGRNKATTYKVYYAMIPIDPNSCIVM